MSKSSILMLSNTSGLLDVTGDAMRADGWYGFTDGLHTIAITLVNFQGRIVFEASIADDPNEEDWFTIPVMGTDFLQFPKNPLSPTGTTGDSTTLGFNIVGSFTWLRCRVDRSYMTLIATDPQSIEALGYVDRVLLNN